MVDSAVVAAETHRPETEFWASELEFDHVRAARELERGNTLPEWIDHMAGQQVRMLCVLLGLDHEQSVQKLRPLLRERASEISPFYIVSQFGKFKSEVAVVEVARESLPPRVMELCAKRTRKPREGGEQRYDKTALLFGLYAEDRRLLKQAFHFDKVHRKGFASMVLADAPRQTPKTPFRAFLTERRVCAILQSYQESRRDGSVCELQGIWTREGRQYVFIRRTERPDHIHDGRSIVHGYRAEWIVLDFSPDGRQVSIASSSVDEPREVADRIASAFFGCDCRFVNEEKVTEAETIREFIDGTRSWGNGVGLVEACVENSPLRGAAKLRISHEDALSLGESLDHFDHAVGDLIESLEDLLWIKVLYRGKRVGLQFEQDGMGDECYVVRYTDQRLNAFERRRFEQTMREDHGVAILSTEKR